METGTVGPTAPRYLDMPPVIQIKQRLKALVFSALLIWLGVTAVLYAFQSRLIYHPHAEFVTTPASAGLQYEDVALTTSDDVAIHGWWLPHPNPRATLLFFHGNAGNISHRIESLKIFHQLGLNVFIIDYRGFGRSEGTPSEQGTYTDAVSAWQWLVGQQGLDADKIVVFGRSLGGSIAAWLAAQYQPGAVILESTFTSIPDMAAKLYPLLPLRWLSLFQYASLEKMPSIESPLWLGHSPEDELIPYAQGQRLFEAARHPKQFFEMKGSHGNGFLISGHPYRESLDEFLGEVFGPQKKGP